MMRGWEGKPSKLVYFKVLPRKRVLFVVNLTHDRGPVQFSSVLNDGISYFASGADRRRRKLTYRNTEVYAAS